MEKNFFYNMKEVMGAYWKRLFKAFFMLLMANLLLIGNPLLFRQAVLTTSSHNFASSYIPILLWGVLLLVVALLSALFRYWMRMEFFTISREVEAQLRSKIFERIQIQSQAFFDHHGIGDLLSRLTNDISAYRDLLSFGFMYPLTIITIIFPGVIALYSISAELTLIALIPLLLVPLINEGLRHHIYRYSHAVQVALAELSNMAQENFSEIRMIKSYMLENAFFERFCGLSRHFAAISMRLSCLQGFLFPLFGIISKMVTLLLVVVFGFIILRASETLNAADFISFMWIQAYIFFPVIMLGWLLPIYARGRAAYDRLVEIYQEPIEVQDNPDSKIALSAQADLVFHNLNFAYPNSSRPVLTDINLQIKGGSFVGITGPYGSGKTTLFRLLNREYEIPEGMISINGEDIHKYSLNNFREELITVEQMSFLFSKSVAANVRFARQEATQDELEAVAQYADLHDTVIAFPEQYETLVGERGVTLSGGQKQRVAIARAFLVERSILLLDDIFSAVDVATEKRIFAALKQNYAGKTVLLITQRTSILDQMDQVLYFSNGQIVEDGSPSELLAKKGYYAALSELQRYS